MTVVLLATLAAAACGNGEAERAGTGLQTVAVERGDLRITAEATGTVEPVRKVEVKSKAGGEILKLYVDVGDHVEPGTLLAEIDPRDVRNSFEQAQADREVAKARADIAKAQLARSEELHAAGVITDQEMESARLENSNSQASLIKANTNLELAQLRLSDVTVRAPMAGTIITKSVEEGAVIQSASQNVSGGTPLFTMANLQAMQVRTLVDETDMGDIKPGMTSTVTVEAFPDRQFQGQVEKIEPQGEVVQNVTQFPVIVTLDNRDGLLKPGMNAEVEILIDQAQDILLVPNNAIVTPQDVGPAAMALGMDIETLDLTQFRRAGTFAGRGNGRGGNGGAQRGGGDRMAQATPPAAGAAGDDGAEARGDGAARPGRVMDPERRARFDSLRARAERGEISQDSIRGLMAGMRGGAAGAAGPAGQGPAGQDATVANGARQARNAVVFVVDSMGTKEPRLVQIGLNDWDRTQILSGLEEGDRIAEIGAAQLQAQQQEFMNRIRGRGGMPFGR